MKSLYKWLKKIFVGEWTGGIKVSDNQGRMGTFEPYKFHPSLINRVFNLLVSLYENIKNISWKTVIFLTAISGIFQGLPSMIEFIPKITGHFIAMVHANSEPKADCGSKMDSMPPKISDARESKVNDRKK